MVIYGRLAAPISDEHAELLRRYREHQERRGFLDSSIRHTRLRLSAFCRCVEPGCITEASKADLEGFLDRRRTRDGRKLEMRTRYYWIAVMHAFYVWAVGEGLAADDPTLTMVRPKQRRVLPRPIGDEDLELAVRGAPSQMRALLTLAAFAGLRVQEIAGLEHDDIIEAKGLIRVRHGKGRKERIVPLHPDVLEALRCLPMPRTGVLSCVPGAARFTPNAMSVIISRYLREHGIDATAHRLRHWFATEVTTRPAMTFASRRSCSGTPTPAPTAGYVAYSHVDAARPSLRFAWASHTHGVASLRT